MKWVKEHKRLLKLIILLFEIIVWKLPLKLSPTRKRRTQILKPVRTHSNI